MVTPDVDDNAVHTVLVEQQSDVVFMVLLL